jgi:hypothetical protein
MTTRELLVDMIQDPRVLTEREIDTLWRLINNPFQAFALLALVNDADIRAIHWVAQALISCPELRPFAQGLQDGIQRYLQARAGGAS